MQINLKEIEKRLQSFFEKQLQQFGGYDPFKLATEKILSVQLDHIIEKNQKKYSPNIYRVTFKKERKFIIQNLDSWITLISKMIKESARKNNLYLSGPIHIQNFFDKTIPEEVNIEVAFSAVATSKTSDLPIGGKENLLSSNIHGGYFISSDEKIFPLTKKVVNIGRDDGNDLVIDNLRVSRVHAQIRELGNYHVLFDLDSTTGTKVNNHKITQHKLSAGDVVEIADNSLIYGIDYQSDSDDYPSSHTRILPIQGKK